MSEDKNLALFEDGGISFERVAETNGSAWWRSHVLMQALGYTSEPAFQKVILKAQQACLSLGIPIEDSFKRETVFVDGREVTEYRLNRFACYLVSMNGDPRKPQVAAAQAYFASIAQEFQRATPDAENVERIVVREELAGGVKSLNSIASRHGVVNHAWFQDAGYRGMYNMNLKTLIRRKGVESGKVLFDFMGRRELAANLFRVTQTEERIRVDRVYGQQPLEQTSEAVGRKVREFMVENTGTRPEDLPIREPIQHVRSGLKKTNRAFRKLDTRSGGHTK